MARAPAFLTLLLLLPPTLGELPSKSRTPGLLLEEKPTSGESTLVPGASHLRLGKLPRTSRIKKPWLRDHLLPSASRARVSRDLSSSTTECQLQSLLLPVTELGLGYDSDETIAFRYCAGSCHSPYTHHGLTLARLSAEGRVMGQPCCHPTQYEDVAFLDNHHHWHHLPQLSAAACGCGI
ncbi:persephin [Sarcophilus harrisii]|uniref:Persephin n=1 Tax=Sarcophilus harrisii TaxID=9305 RepID=A0A7N4NKR9_SARHA|nr:persephin [Sarcophilus harrisii]